MKQLTAISGRISEMRLNLGTDKATVNGLTVVYMMEFSDLAKGTDTIWTPITTDVWARLSPTQQQALQDIRNTLEAELLKDLT